MKNHFDYNKHNFYARFYVIEIYQVRLARYFGGRHLHIAARVLCAMA